MSGKHKVEPPISDPFLDDDPSRWEHLAPAWNELGLLHRLTIVPFYILIRLYQRYISPHKPPTCRFVPSCSQYTVLALRKYNLALGILMGAWRILRCNPWGGYGYDPP